MIRAEAHHSLSFASRYFLYHHVSFILSSSLFVKLGFAQSRVKNNVVEHGSTSGTDHSNSVEVTSEVSHTFQMCL